MSTDPTLYRPGRALALRTEKSLIDGEFRMRPQSLVCVRDVEASSRWYHRLLGRHSAHGGLEYERLASDGRLVLQYPPSGEGGPNHWECGLRDPDGYSEVLASPDGSAGGVE